MVIWGRESGAGGKLGQIGGRNTRTDLLPEPRPGETQPRAQLEGEGASEGMGGEAGSSVSGCRLANLSSSSLMRQEKAGLKQKASFKGGPASRLLLC